MGKTSATVTPKKSKLTEKELKYWWHKDIIDDSIPGISLDKAFKELLANKKGEKIIVAVIDTKLDIHHEDKKSQVWVNPNEIFNNGIDDDKNGWNFQNREKLSTPILHS